MDTNNPEIEKNEIFTGVLPDTRTPEEKARDYRFEEFASAFPEAKWAEKKIDDFAFYERRDQANSDTCVAQTAAKMMGILVKQRTGKYFPFSATFPYQKRFNKPAGGMAMWDIFKLMQEGGMTFEQFMPSQNMSEAEITKEKGVDFHDEIAPLFKIGMYAYAPADIETIAAIVQAGNPVMLFVYANRDEYTLMPKIKNPSLNPSTAAIRHSITAVDTVLYKGKKCLVIDDSWGIINIKTSTEDEKKLKERGQRLFDADWISKRVYAVGYISDQAFKWDTGVLPIPPSMTAFNSDLEFGMQSDEVKRMQDFLKAQGHFPLNVTSTGGYYGITMQAVQKFQLKHGIAAEGDAGFGRFGPKTRAKANSIISNK